jgi:hypothetical protein
MNSRVMLLVLVTGLFVGIWGSTDRAGRQLAGRHARKSSELQPRLVSEERFVEQLSSEATSDVIAPTATSYGRIPLPADITPGDYLVIDNHGNVTPLSLGASDLQYQLSPELVESDAYLVRKGADRWHFVRLDAAVKPEVELPTTSDEVPMPVFCDDPEQRQADQDANLYRANRKFDFTGYMTEG